MNSYNFNNKTKFVFHSKAHKNFGPWKQWNEFKQKILFKISF